MHGIHVHTPKISRARLVCLGNKALATRTASFTLLLLNAFLACLVISFLRASSALRLIPRVKPVVKPLLILLGSFKGFRVLLRPCNPHASDPSPTLCLVDHTTRRSEIVSNFPLACCLLLLHQGCLLLFFTGARLFLYSHEVARKRFPRIAFSFSLSDFLHAFQMRFSGILFRQLF